MAFDAKQAVTETITHLEDELKGLKAQREAATNDLDTKIRSVEEQLDGWVALLGADKPAAKKAAAKRSN